MVFALAAGLWFAAAAYRSLRPRPSLNPFDNRWVMDNRWLARNADTLEWLSCGYRAYYFEQGDYRVGFEHYFRDSLLILGKGIEVPIARFDTSVYRWIEVPTRATALLAGAQADQRLDSVLSKFGLSYLDAIREEPTWSRRPARRYRNPAGDTLLFQAGVDPPYRSVDGRVRVFWFWSQPLPEQFKPAYREQDCSTLGCGLADALGLD